MVNTKIQIFQLEQLLIYYLNQCNFDENQIVDICQNFESHIPIEEPTRFNCEKHIKKDVCNEMDTCQIHLDGFGQRSNLEKSNNAELGSMVKNLKKSIHKNIMLRLKKKIQSKYQRSKEFIKQEDFAKQS